MSSSRFRSVVSGKARGAAELFDSKARHPTSESLDQQEIFARINAARKIARHIKRRAQAKAKIRNRRAMLRAHGVGPPAQLRLYNQYQERNFPVLRARQFCISDVIIDR